MLEILLYRLHPLLSHDCLLEIRHKKGDYIHMEIGGDWCLQIVFRSLIMYLCFLAYDVFHFSFDVFPFHGLYM